MIVILHNNATQDNMIVMLHNNATQQDNMIVILHNNATQQDTTTPQMAMLIYKNAYRFT
jgi:hypothetical protein